MALTGVLRQQGFRCPDCCAFSAWLWFCATFALRRVLEVSSGKCFCERSNLPLPGETVLWGYLESNQGPLLYQCGAGDAHDLRSFAFPQVESRFQLSSLPVTCHRFAFVSGLNVACPC